MSLNFDDELTTRSVDVFSDDDPFSNEPIPFSSSEYTEAMHLEPLPKYYEKYSSAVFASRQSIFPVLENVLTEMEDCEFRTNTESHQVSGVIIRAGRHCKFLISLFNCAEAPDPCVENKKTGEDMLCEGGTLVEFCRRHGPAQLFTLFYHQCLASIAAFLALPSPSAELGHPGLSQTGDGPAWQQGGASTPPSIRRTRSLYDTPALNTSSLDTNETKTSKRQSCVLPLLAMTSRSASLTRVEAWSALTGLASGEQLSPLLSCLSDHDSDVSNGDGQEEGPSGVDNTNDNNPNSPSLLLSLKNTLMSCSEADVVLSATVFTITLCRALEQGREEVLQLLATSLLVPLIQRLRTSLNRSNHCRQPTPEQLNTHDGVVAMDVYERLIHVLIARQVAMILSELSMCKELLRKDEELMEVLRLCAGCGDHQSCEHARGLLSLYDTL